MTALEVVNETLLQPAPRRGPAVELRSVSKRHGKGEAAVLALDPFGTDAVAGAHAEKSPVLLISESLPDPPMSRPMPLPPQSVSLPSPP